MNSHHYGLDFCQLLSNWSFNCLVIKVLITQQLVLEVSCASHAHPRIVKSKKWSSSSVPQQSSEQETETSGMEQLHLKPTLTSLSAYSMFIAIQPNILPTP